ncbi:MAG: nuclear transport factor 2 family protein [Candidatus Dormibacteraeota bacterium]|nr:nuclear transport factor 2 family protein [Candidatus Dormibacteraeota bacterium]MBO0762089.1 nuclear transport factor 2 family protein [Candidatus Dormibacteraeota bacterium]
MGERENRQILEDEWTDGKLRPSPEAEHAARAEDFVMEMPQSGERIVGRDTMRALQEAYPHPPSATLRRIVGSGDVFVVEGFADYGSQVAHVVNVVEFQDGKIAKETRYYSAPFDPPEWRARFVERM